MKTVKLISNQIPAFWDAIKFACVKADNVKEEFVETYLISLLLDLLSDKAQCFVRQTKDFKVGAVLVTRIVTNKITGANTLQLECLYSYEQASEEEWRDGFKLVVEFAKKNNCKNVVTMSSNPTVWKLITGLGMKELTREFVISV